ncbi:Uncharacterised protein [Mycobacteroides abscessus subsp. abscessus]|nr:Uncharacterised protein [Mycobacteroides abscessus subsp. abscessus]
MDEVLLHLLAPVAAEVAADRAGGGRRRVGRPGQRAEAGDDALPGGDDRDDRALGHEVDERLVERLALVLGVVGGEFLGGGGAQAQRIDRVALGLDAGEDLSDESPGDSVGLDEDERAFHSGPSGR